MRGFSPGGVLAGHLQARDGRRRAEVMRSSELPSSDLPPLDNGIDAARPQAFRTMHALEIRGLTKTYKNGVQALKGIDLDVEEGDFFALLGPNGAGKTTLIGIVTSLVNKTGGQVSVFGHDIDHELEAAKSCIGVVPQELNFNLFEAPRTIVINQAGFYGIDRAIARERAEKYLKQLQLWDK